MNESDLKPCPNPWCDSNKTIPPHDIKPHIYHREHKGFVGRCVACGVVTDDWKQTPKAAIEIWNTRPNPINAELVEALKGVMKNYQPVFECCVEEHSSAEKFENQPDVVVADKALKKAEEQL